jgi:RHS repeat-associated protein
MNSVTTTYYYDSQSRRIAHTTSSATTLYVYDAWNCIAEYQLHSSLFTIHSSYLWGPDLSHSMQGAGGVGGLLMVSEIESSNTSNYFPLYDGNGNVTEYINSSEEVVAHYAYDPFGNTTVASEDKADDFAYRFSTKPIDATTGLYYYGYRWYDPATGRWPSSDPIEESGGLNLHGFVGNDGLNKWDYLGLKTEYSSIIFAGHGWHTRGIPGTPGYDGSVEKNMINTEKEAGWDKERDRVSALSCFNGNINSRFPRSIKSARDQFDDISIPDSFIIFNSLNGKSNKVWNPAEPGFLWRKAPVIIAPWHPSMTKIHGYKIWKYTGEDEAYLLIDQKIRDAENQAERDLVQFKQDKKPCSIKLQVICPDVPSSRSNPTIDFRAMIAPAGKDSPCGYENTYKYYKRGSKWSKKKFNEGK